LILTTSISWAGSDSDKEIARTIAGEATAAYNIGDYIEAADLYEEAYRLVPDPVFLFNLGQCYRQSGKPDKALIAYQSYLKSASEYAPYRFRVEEWIEELESILASQVKLTKTKFESKPKPEPILFPSRPNPFPEINLVKSDPKIEASFPWKRSIPWIGVGVTSALGIASLVEGLSTRSSYQDLKNSCGKTSTCTDSQVQSVRSKSLITNVLLGVAAATAIATGISFYLNLSGTKSAGISLAW
jgi:tetratricopeptide (TPR) repeat protein